MFSSDCAVGSSPSVGHDTTAFALWVTKSEMLRFTLGFTGHAIAGRKGSSGGYNLSPTDHSGVDRSGVVLVKIVNGAWKLEDNPKF